MADNLQLQAMLNNFEQFLANSTPADISDLNKAIMTVQTRKAESAERVAAYNKALKAGVKKGKKTKGTGGPKRPQNSWMAFRSK
jgi:hypothetical protein